MARMFLVDGSYQAFRSHFAQPPRHTSSGFPTHVLYGFLLLFQKMLKTWQPDYVVVSFDTSTNFRNDIYPDYKGHRPDMPDDLRQQWSSLTDLVEGFGYTALNIDGYEADDVLGTLAKQFAGDDMEVYLVTADKDFCQLVDDNIQLLDDMKGLVIDHDGVIDKFGVPPDKVIDVLALAGDTSDNVPGVHKIGVKTGAKFVNQFGDLEAVLAAAVEGLIKGKTGQRLIDEADMARLSKRLVTIDTKVPLNLTLEDLVPAGLQQEQLTELFDRWEFGKVARSLLGVQQGITLDGFTAPATPIEIGAALGRVRQGMPGFQLIWAEGTERELQPVPVGVVFSGKDGAGVYIDFEVDGAAEQVYALLADPDVPKIGHGLKRVYRSLAKHGEGLAGVVGDTRLLDYIIGAHRKTHDLEGMVSSFLYHSLGKAEGADVLQGPARLAAESALCVAQLQDKLLPKMSDGQRSLYREIELPLTPVLARMELAGIRLDVEQIRAVDSELKGRLDTLEAECHELAGKEFNVRSRHALRDVLFVDLGLKPTKKVKDGWSTASDVLEKLVGEHPLPRKVLDYRELDKLRGTYLTKLPTYVDADDRIHTTLNQAVAATGRLSSNDPNLQNIPVRTVEGRRIRECFVPAAGHVFLSADYSQVELRILAHFTGDPVLTKGFKGGEDIHRRTAIEVFGADPADVTVAQRSAAKAINFGLIYGMSAFRLAGDLAISREEAQRYMDEYFARMPAVQGWIEDTKASCHKHGYVDTMFGRRRLIPEIHSTRYSDRMGGEREAVNTCIQGTAADVIKIAMLHLDEALLASDLQARVVLQVHDELLLEVPEGEVERTAELVRDKMQAAVALDVPLGVHTTTGRTWEEAHG